MHCKSYSHFFSKKFQHIWVSLDVNFNESLTNDIVSFEQLGPECYLKEVCADIFLQVVQDYSSLVILRIEIVFFLDFYENMMWNMQNKLSFHMITKSQIRDFVVGTHIIGY